MTVEELKFLIGKFGLVNVGRPAIRKMLHGRIKYVADDGLVFFKTTAAKEMRFLAKDINSFEEKEPLPEVLEFNHKKVIWDGGLLCYPEDLKDRKEINLKR